jgi:AcrR family transcriptional regulator
MSPRKAGALRGDDTQNLRQYLIATAARLIGERGTGALTVRDIAREAQVADGVLYNYFEDKEDLLANALLAHVAEVMGSAPPLLPEPGTGTVADNLRRFIEGGLEVLTRVTPAFAGLMSQPKVLVRFHDMVGGDAAFGADAPGTRDEEPGTRDEEPGTRDEEPGTRDEEPGTRDEEPGTRDEEQHGRGLPDMLAAYLRAEQRLGRVAAGADVDAAVILVVGAIHGQVLPRQIFSPPGAAIAPTPSDIPGRLAETVLAGIAPVSVAP